MISAPLVLHPIPSYLQPHTVPSNVPPRCRRMSVAAGAYSRSRRSPGVLRPRRLRRQRSRLGRAHRRGPQVRTGRPRRRSTARTSRCSSSTITKIVESIPSACRVHLVSKRPGDVPGLRVLDSVARLAAVHVARHDGHQGSGAGHVPPGDGEARASRRAADGERAERRSLLEDTTLLSRYGPQQAKKNQEVLMAHAGNAFEKPGASVSGAHERRPEARPEPVAAGLSGGRT